MFNFDYITKEDIAKHNSNWPQIPDYPYRILKAHRQISKKRCFEKNCSCDKACQFLALQGTN